MLRISDVILVTSPKGLNNLANKPSLSTVLGFGSVLVSVTLLKVFSCLFYFGTPPLRFLLCLFHDCLLCFLCPFLQLFIYFVVFSKIRMIFSPPLFFPLFSSESSPMDPISSPLSYYTSFYL